MKRTIAFAMAFIMIFALCAGFANAANTVSYTAIYGISNGAGFYCKDRNISLTLDLTDMSYANVNYCGYYEGSTVTGNQSGFAFYYNGNLISGVLKDDCVILGGIFDGQYYTFTLVNSGYAANGSYSGTVTNNGAGATRESLIANVQAQGVEVPGDIAISDPNGRYVTVYSNDRDNTTRLKSKPLNGDASCVISVLRFPFNAYVYGTANGWSLVKTDDGIYGYIYTPILGMADITTTNANARRGEGLIPMIQAQGIGIPKDFNFSDVIVGEIRNEAGSPYYALYKYSSPFALTTAESYGKFYYYNSSNSSTYNYDGKVTIYGYYGDFVLFQTKAGEFFWAHTTNFFKAS